MKKLSLTIISFILLVSCALLPKTVSASFPFDTTVYLKPPIIVNVQFARFDYAKYPIFNRTTIFNALWKIPLDINAEGGFSKTISEESKLHSADRFKDGNPPEGVFTIRGTYKKGHISSEWTYELNFPPRKDWNHPETYSASGTFYTYQPITEQSGTGIIEGSITSTRTYWKDDKMVETVEKTASENIRGSWVADSKCLLGICGCFETPEEVDSKARFNSVTGEVGYVHCNKSESSLEWIPATPKVVLMVNDHISTGIDSAAILQFEDMTTFQMKPETEVVVKSPPEQETKLGLVGGHLWINFKKMLTNGTMEVEMGQAVAGIKGTTLVLEQKNGVSSVKVIEGVVTFTSRETGKSVDVNAGETVSADFNGLSQVSKFDVATESASWKTIETKNSKGQSGTAPLIIILPIAVLAIAGGSMGFFLLRRKNKKGVN